MGSSWRKQWWATVAGLLAILMWASLVAVARGVRAHMGVLQSAAAANLLAGCIGLAAGPIRTRPMQYIRHFPLKYLLGCGGLFVLYHVTFYPAIDRAATHVQTVEVALIDYLWPTLSLAFTVPLLHKRASIWLVPGLLAATLGAGWGVSQGAVSWASLRSGIAANPWPYALALVAAISWALYSNLTRRWAANVKDSAVPLFLLATGLALTVLAALGPGVLHVPLRPGPLMELAYFTLFPTLVAYLLWDLAMRQGNVVLVVSASFLTPLLSTLISCLYLGVPLSSGLLVAACLVVAGAFVCRRSIS